MLLKCCSQYVSKFGKLISGHRTEKSQFSFQSQRRVMPKNVQITVQLYLFHMLVKVMFKIFQATLQQYLNEELTDVPPGSSRPRQGNQRSNYQHLLYHRESKGIPGEKIYFCFTDYAKAFIDYFVDLLTTPKPLTVWITTNCGKFLKRWRYQTTCPAS